LVHEVKFDNLGFTFLCVYARSGIIEVDGQYCGASSSPWPVGGHMCMHFSNSTSRTVTNSDGTPNRNAINYVNKMNAVAIVAYNWLNEDSDI
jgi:hypothetical protein